MGPPQVQHLLHDLRRVVRGCERATGRLLTSPASPSLSNAARQT